jgi:acetyl/propionyl-CoA carboxylase alpha subunit
MADQQLVIRDEDGREHHATLKGENQIVVGDTVFEVAIAVDGSLEVRGADIMRVWTVSRGDLAWVFAEGRAFTFEISGKDTPRRRVRSRDGGALTAPMPATVRKIEVAVGSQVRQGDVLILLEAMKMELPVRAPADGIVRRLNCREGEMVQAGQELVEVSV